MRRLSYLGVLIPFLCLHTGIQTVHVAGQDSVSNDAVIEEYREAAEKRWSKSISEFDVLNGVQDRDSEAILFIGSSSIRRWETMPKDMVPYRTIRRGYGGAKFTDMAVFAKRLITPHEFRAVVMFIGNGVVGKPEDHTPDQIESLARSIVAAAHDHRNNAAFFLIEITPCEKRFDAWPKIRAVNARLREVALSTPNTYFIPTASHYLKPDGTPRSEFFGGDKLHLNQQGYQLWSKIIRRRLDDVFQEASFGATHEE